MRFLDRLMIIRKFQLNDLDQVMKIWLESNIQAHPFVEKSYWHEHFSEVREAMQTADVLIAEKDSEILGFAGMQNDYLAGIFVKREYRHQGIGNRLLQTVRNTHPLVTLNVYVANKPAVNFYKHHKFHILKEQIDETGNLEYVMKWKK